MTAAAGVCRFCGCSEDSACRAHRRRTEFFSWADDERTICNAWECLKRRDQAKLSARRPPAFRIDDKAGRVRRFTRKKKKGEGV